MSEIVFAIAGHRGHIETLDVTITFASVSVNDVVNRTFVVLLIDLQVLNVLTDENLLGNTHDLELSVFVEDDDVVDVGAVAHEFVFLQRRSDEPLVAVDVEFLVGLHHLRGLDGVEVANLCAAWVVSTIFFFDVAEPFDGHIHHVFEVVVDLFNLALDARHQLVGLVLVELQDALHLDFHQSKDVFASHLSDEAFLEGLDAAVNVSHHSVHILGVLELLVLVDALFDEYFFQRREEELLFKFALADEQFLAQKPHSRLHRMAKHVADGQEAGLLVLNDAAVGGDVDFAIAEGKEGIKRLVARHTRSQMHENLGFGGCVVFHLLGFDFPSLDGFQDGIDERTGVFREGNLANGECFLVEFLDFCTHFQHTATLTVVVSRHVDGASRWEVGIEGERFAF